MRDDLRAAVRSLRSSKSFTTAALIVLTLGVGATTAIFSVVDAVVLRGLPFDEHDRLAAVGERRRPSGQFAPLDRDPESVAFVAPQNYFDWAAQQQVFESIGAIASGWLTLREPGGEPESLVPQRVTAGFFDVLRVRPVIGRAFTKEDEVVGRSRVAILSNGLWRRRFAADPQIIGRPIPLEDVASGPGAAEGGRYEVIGVMPQGFTYPVGVARTTDIWVPYVVPPDQQIRNPQARSQLSTGHRPPEAGRVVRRRRRGRWIKLPQPSSGRTRNGTRTTGSAYGRWSITSSARAFGRGC